MSTMMFCANFFGGVGTICSICSSRMDGRQLWKKGKWLHFAAHTDATEWLESDEKGAADFSMRPAISGDNTLVGTYFSNLKSSNRTGIVATFA